MAKYLLYSVISGVITIVTFIVDIKLEYINIVELNILYWVLLDYIQGG